MKTENTLPLKRALGARLRWRSCDHIKGSRRRKRSPSSERRWREIQKTMYLFGQPNSAAGRDHSLPGELDQQWVELKEKIDLRGRLQEKECIPPKKPVRKSKPQRPAVTPNAEGRRAALRLYRKGQIPIGDLPRVVARRLEYEAEYDKRNAESFVSQSMTLQSRMDPVRRAPVSTGPEEVKGTARERAELRRRGALRRRGR